MTEFKGWGSAKDMIPWELGDRGQGLSQRKNQEIGKAVWRRTRDRIAWKYQQVKRFGGNGED